MSRCFIVYWLVLGRGYCFILFFHSPTCILFTRYCRNMSRSTLSHSCIPLHTLSHQGKCMVLFFSVFFITLIA